MLQTSSRLCLKRINSDALADVLCGSAAWRGAGERGEHKRVATSEQGGARIRQVSQNPSCSHFLCNACALCSVCVTVRVSPRLVQWPSQPSGATSSEPRASQLQMARLRHWQHQCAAVVCCILLVAQCSAALRFGLGTPSFTALLGWRDRHKMARDAVLSPASKQGHPALKLDEAEMKKAEVDDVATLFDPKKVAHIPGLARAAASKGPVTSSKPQTALEETPDTIDMGQAVRMGRITSVAYCSDESVIEGWSCSRCQRVPQFQSYKVSTPCSGHQDAPARPGFSDSANHALRAQPALCTGRSPSLTCGPALQVVFDRQWDLLGYVGYDALRDAVVVAFRGTDSHSWGNWINNLKTWRANKMYPVEGHTGAYVHAGTQLFTHHIAPTGSSVPANARPWLPTSPHSAV